MMKTVGAVLIRRGMRKMKKPLRSSGLACGIALVFALLLAPVLAQAEGQYALVKGGRLHLRAAADASSASLGLYDNGTWVEVLNAAQNANWYYVRTDDGRYGYMSRNYLTLDSSASMASGTVQNPNGYVNLRAYASLNAQVLGRYESGTGVEILARLSTGWTQVRIGAQTGYMVSDFVQSSVQSTQGRITSRYGGRINLRSAPMSDGAIITSLPTGASVTVLLSGKNWHKISADGYTGYIAAQYVSTSGTSSSSGSMTAVVNNPRSTQVLNLRAQPSLDAKVLGYYTNGTQVRVVSKGATWCEVYVGTKHGYMMTQYLSFSSAAGETATLYNPNGGSVVNMRAGASLSSSITGIYAVGTQVTVLSRGTEWCHVSIGSQTGYVSAYFLR